MTATSPLKITLFTRSLNQGGAERQLLYLARGLKKMGHQVIVLTLYAPTKDWYPHDDIRLHHLNKKSRWDVFGFAKSYISFLKSEQPDVLYSFLTVQNIIACMTSLFTKTKIFCGVRASDMELSHYSQLDIWLDRLEKILFRLNVRIISNSHAGKTWIAQKNPGLENKIDVIPNGIDLADCTYSVDSRDNYRKLWGVTEQEVLIGHVGRYDPMKDHTTFFKAAEIVLKQIPSARFVCWGHGPDDYTEHLKQTARTLNIPIIWHTEQGNPCYSAFDLYCSSSAFGEGHSNTLTESMAHGIPCIATHVGDAKYIVGNFGTIVPKENPDDLAAAIIRVIESNYNKLDPNQIDWIRENYSLDRLIKLTSEKFF